MSEVENLKSFLRSISYEENRPAPPDAAKGQYPFVTISRQTGAGGHSLAAAILKRLEEEPDPVFKGWKMFDQEICRLVAEDPSLKVSMDALFTEAYRTQVADLLSEFLGGYSPQNTVTKKMFETILSLATCGKVILVGRGGACLTRELPLGVHLRLVAPLPRRIERMSKLLGVSEANARNLVHDQDKSRALLIKDHFNRNIEDPLLYDAVWNTETVSLEEIASAAAGMIRAKMAVSLQRSLT